jgi:hypothetical protein
MQGRNAALVGEEAARQQFIKCQSHIFAFGHAQLFVFLLHILMAKETGRPHILL